MSRPFVAKVFNLLGDIFFGGLIVCLAGLGAIALYGCSSTPGPVAPPTPAQVDDLKQCAVDLADIARRSREMAQDGGAE